MRVGLVGLGRMGAAGLDVAGFGLDPGKGGVARLGAAPGFGHRPQGY
jgi:hypothetical protein